MLNETLLKTGPSFNDFTAALRDLTIDGTPVLVRMRDGRWLKVRYQPEVPRQYMEGFVSDDFGSPWEIDGRSVTSQDFDLVEFEDGKRST